MKIKAKVIFKDGQSKEIDFESGGTVMPQNAETLIFNKHNRIMNNLYITSPIDFSLRIKEWARWAKELNSLNSPQIDRRPKK